MISNSKMIWAALCMVVLAVSSCSRKPSEVETNKTVEAAGTTSNTPVEISKTLAIERLIQRDVETVGTLIADQEVTVSSQVKGEVSEINVDLGSVVKAGQIIARISPREYQLKLEQAEASLQQARARLGLKGENDKLNVEDVAEVKQAKASLDEAKLNLDRTQKLVASGDVSRERFDAMEISYRTMEARYQAARDNTYNLWGIVAQRQAEFKLAQKNLEDSTIKAPIDGTVSAKRVSRGEYIAENGGNRNIVTIVKSNPLRLQCYVSEIGISFVKSGLPVEFSVDAYPGRTFPAAVSRISPVVNSQSRLLLVEATAPNADGLLKAGLFAKVFVKVSNKIPAVLIPSKAVTAFAGINKVFVIDNNRVIEREVKLGLRDGDLIEITDGVKPGEAVATTNIEKLSNGKTVISK